MITKQCYLVVDQNFADAYDGYQQGANILKVATTTDGRKVISLNAVNIFIELFEGKDQTTFPAVILSLDDFPRATLPFLNA